MRESVICFLLVALSVTGTFMSVSTKLNLIQLSVDVDRLSSIDDAEAHLKQKLNTSASASSAAIVSAEQTTSSSLRATDLGQARVAVHVAGPVTAKNNFVKNDFVDVLDWKKVEQTASEKSYHRSGRLVVPQDGLYFVYSSVQFVVYADDFVGKTAETVDHRVLKRNKNYPNGGTVTLMNGSNNISWTQSGAVVMTDSYLGGVHSLQANDELFIRLSRHTVEGRAESTYCGFFSLSD